jgi:ATP-dependent RNA helicase DDX35
VCLSIEGRAYPVDTFYLSDPTDDYITCAVNTVMEIHVNEAPGDVLVFMCGKEDVDQVVQMLKERGSELGGCVFLFILCY